MSEYAERDIEEQGEYYSKHVMAMTAEKLHGKSDIAAELAHRDIQITELQAYVNQLRSVVKALAGDDVLEIPMQYDVAMVLLEETPQQSLKALTDWKDIVIEMLITSHIYRKEHEDNPRQAIIDLIHWDNHIALDPQVSSAAQALKDKGWNEAIDAVLDLEGYVVQDSPDSMTVTIGKADIRELRREVDDGNG